MSFERPTNIPKSPGSYQFYDKNNKVIYVGKAKSLRQRLSSYFAPLESLDPKTASMVTDAVRVEWIEVGTDKEALLLEQNLIKTHIPRYNIRLVDDKSYPMIAITVKDQWPAVRLLRGTKKKGIRYFGPFAHARATRITLDQLIKSFPLRTCADSKFKLHEKSKKPCLLYHIKKCSGPCINAVSPDDYRASVEDLTSFLRGNVTSVVTKLKEKMAKLSESLEFERASAIRDQIATIEAVFESQRMIGDEKENYDVFSISGDELSLCAQWLFVREGMLIGQRKTFVDRTDDSTLEEIVSSVFVEHYSAMPSQGVPPFIYCTVEPNDLPTLIEALSEIRSGSVSIAVPKRGHKLKFVDMATENAQHSFERRKLKRASDFNSRMTALKALKEELDLPDAPLRIECFDMSHMQGTNYVGSMVVLEDGIPKKSEYRRFTVKEVDGNNDFAAMEEVLRRRLIALIESRISDIVKSKFSYPPNLLLVDGGKGQLTSAEKVLKELGLTEEISVASLAKRYELVHTPNHREGIYLPRSSPSLFLLQVIRDEAHRFAVSFHREKRQKAMKKSVLDSVPGLGPKRKSRLLKELGSLSAVKKMSSEELRSISWLPDDIGAAIYDALHR